MGCLQSKSSIRHVKPRTEANDVRNSNGFANGARGTPKAKRSSKYISPANSVENIQALRNLPRPDSRRSRRSVQTPYPEPTMPPTPETDKRTMVVQYAEDLEPADYISPTDIRKLGTGKDDKFSRVTDVNLKPVPDGLYHKHKPDKLYNKQKPDRLSQQHKPVQDGLRYPQDGRVATTAGEQTMAIEDLESDTDGYVKMSESHPARKPDIGHPNTADSLLLSRRKQQPLADYAPPHHPAMSPRHKLEQQIKHEKQDVKQTAVKTPKTSTKSEVPVIGDTGAKHQNKSYIPNHTSQVMFLNGMEQEGKEPDTPQTPVATPKSPVEYMFTVGRSQKQSDVPESPHYQPQQATSSKDSADLYGDDRIRKKKTEIAYKSPRYLSPSPQNKFENKVAIEHFLGKQDPRSPRRLVLAQKKNTSAFVDDSHEEARMSVQQQNWTSHRDDKSEHFDSMEGFLTHESFECVDELLDVEHTYNENKNMPTFTSDTNDWQYTNIDKMSPQKTPATLMPKNISEVKVKKERLKRKRKRSGRKASADSARTLDDSIATNQYESDVYLQDISSVSDGIRSRQGSAASTHTVGSAAASQGTIQSFMKPGFKARPIFGHSRATGQSRSRTLFHSDNIVNSTPNASRFSNTNKTGQHNYPESRLHFREVSCATSSTLDTNAPFPEINSTTRYAYASGMTNTSVRENSVDILSQASVDSLDISGSTAEFGHLPARFQDTYQAIDDEPISPKRHNNVEPVANDAMEYSGDSHALCVEDFDVSAEQPSGSSSSLFSTKQKLLYSKYARSSRPKSDTTFGPGGRPPLPPGRQRPHSDYTKPLSFSKYFTNDTDLL